MPIDLALLAAVLTVTSLGFYVLLDGFDLGVGALMATTSDRALRDRLARAIEPTWDGNETWLIMAGVALLAAFPTAYSILLAALYLPLFGMLVSLGFRAVAFDFRRQEGPLRRFWDRMFAAGSVGAAWSQGVALGALIEGLEVRGESFAGSVFAVLRPYPLLVGATLVLAYGVLGAGWARWRLPARDRPFVDRRLRQLLPVSCGLALLTIAGALHVQPMLAARLAALWPIVALSLATTGAAMIGVWRATRGAADAAAFCWAVLGAASSLGGLVATFAPDIVPFRLDVWAAAAPSSSLIFYLAGSGLVVPVIFGYTAYAYWVFRGKITEEA